MYRRAGYLLAPASIRLGLLVALSLALAVSVGPVPAAHAAYLTVTNANDSGPGSLRAAIAAASPGDTIRFVRELRGQTITLTSGPLDITQDLTILGPGASQVAISGSEMTRVLHIGPFATVRLDNLAIIDGEALSGTVRIGGGIANDGTLIVNNSTIASNGATLGGGIYNNGTLTVSSTTFDQNFAVAVTHQALPLGSAIANYGQLTVVNSTFYDNYTFTILNFDAGMIYNYNTLRVTNSTFFHGEGEDDQVGIRNAPASPAVVKNTLLAAYCQGSFSSDSSHNLATSRSCGPGVTVVSEGELQLGRLQDNGGTTRTIGLLPGSVAIDAGDPTTCAAEPVANRDQRGMPRPQGQGCDIGAFEAEPQNRPPLANDDSYITALDTPLTVAAPGVLVNDSDPDNGLLQALLSGDPSYGHLTLNSDGSFTYTPVKGFTGTDSFVYNASDGTENTSAATVTITVAAVVANNDHYLVPADTPLTIEAPGVLANDTQADGKPLVAQLVAGPSHGELTLIEDGTFKYLPEPGFTGEDQFTYLPSDGNNRSNVATVTISVE